MVTSHNLNQPAPPPVDLNQPIALDPRNFTSLQRTPWAGTELASGIKSQLSSSTEQRIGESWEMSCDPDSPSRLTDSPSWTLIDLVSTYPEACLSQALVSAGRNTCDILVKLLNADLPLSLQIHPSDHHPALQIHECGKPESWLVLSAKPGAGLYLGFSQALDIKELRMMLEHNTFSSDLLQFVPVVPGDYFEIEPHVPHAIGPGVVLLEPQRIIAGKSGKTWRMWDWNRKYDVNGAIDPHHGKPRQLHIDESLTLIHPEVQYSLVYANSFKRKPETCEPAPGIKVRAFPANPWYQTLSVTMKPQSAIPMNQCIGYGCLTTISGEIMANEGQCHQKRLPQGQSFFLPAQCLPLTLANPSTKTSELTMVIPAGKGTNGLGRRDIQSLFTPI